MLELPVRHPSELAARGVHSTLQRRSEAMEDDNRLSYFFLGLGLGVAVGVLFAPKAGAETRDLIRSKANEGADFAKRRANDLRDQAAEALERGKQTISRQKENLTAAVEAGKQAYRDATAPSAD
jgi:gas vesicle protein